MNLTLTLTLTQPLEVSIFSFGLYLRDHTIIHCLCLCDNIAFLRVVGGRHTVISHPTRFDGHKRCG